MTTSFEGIRENREFYDIFTATEEEYAPDIKTLKKALRISDTQGVPVFYLFNGHLKVINSSSNSSGNRMKLWTRRLKSACCLGNLEREPYKIEERIREVKAAVNRMRVSPERPRRHAVALISRLETPSRPNLSSSFNEMAMVSALTEDDNESCVTRAQNLINWVDGTLPSREGRSYSIPQISSQVEDSIIYISNKLKRVIEELLQSSNKQDIYVELKQLEESLMDKVFETGSVSERLTVLESIKTTLESNSALEDSFFLAFKRKIQFSDGSSIEVL